jgi:putative hemolysin
MTTMLQRGRLRARQAMRQDDLAASLALRAMCFHGRGAGETDALDADCVHMLVEDSATGALVCSFRMLLLQGADLGRSYSAQFYDLSALSAFDGAMLEMGRFCIHPGAAGDPDVLRLAWGAMTAFVDVSGVKMLFGCSSFPGTRADIYLDSFALLKARHLAPERWAPQIKAPDVHRYGDESPCDWDAKRAMRMMPPLLRTYLLMGGWVSDHAVVDAQMETLHVFTGVEIRAIPEARKRLLRAVAR